MKKIILLLLLVSVVATTFSQDTTGKQLSKEYYLQKSKNKKTTAWILLGAGTTAIVVGLLVEKNGENSNDFYSGTEQIGAGALIAALGAVADIVSIPFFISAGKNKRLAATVSLNDIYLTQHNSIAIKPQPALSVKLNF